MMTTLKNIYDIWNFIPPVTQGLLKWIKRSCGGLWDGSCNGSDVVQLRRPNAHALAFCDRFWERSFDSFSNRFCERFCEVSATASGSSCNSLGARSLSLIVQWLLRRIGRGICDGLCDSFCNRSSNGLAVGIGDGSCDRSWEISYNESKFKKLQSTGGSDRQQQQYHLGYQCRRSTCI